MGEDPSVIRAEIEETRARVGDEVDALSYKTDVGARASDFVDEKKEAVKSKVMGAKDAVTGTATKAVPSRQQFATVKDTAERNPFGLAIAGVAAGFVIGTLLPSTRIEDERLGEASDRVVDAGKETAGEAVDRGKQVAKEASRAAVETAKESGKEQTDELTSTLQERAQGVTDDSPSTESAARTPPSSGTTAPGV
jgi:hypothetical protein